MTATRRSSDTSSGGQPGRVVSVVAKSGSGKTTLLERLIPELRARGLRVGVLKHHSHLSSFDVPGKDTSDRRQHQP